MVEKSPTCERGICRSSKMEQPRAMVGALVSASFCGCHRRAKRRRRGRRGIPGADHFFTVSAERANERDFYSAWRRQEAVTPFLSGQDWIAACGREQRRGEEGRFIARFVHVRTVKEAFGKFHHKDAANRIVHGGTGNEFGLICAATVET